MDFEQVIKDLADVADIADEVGNYDEADAVAKLLSKANMVRLAQYEGGQNYWTLNQRAFERAWRIKREKAGLTQTAPTTPDQFKSAQECWLEVLEEYQDALLGNDAEMLSKYAAAEEHKDNPSCPECGHYNAMLEHWDEVKGEFSRKCRDCGHEEKKPDPSTETADNGCTTTMSDSMTKFHKDLESGSDGPSEGEQITRKFGPKGFNAGAAISREIMNKISERLMAGSAPGVAVYEALDHFTSGEYEREILVAAMENAQKIAGSISEELLGTDVPVDRDEKINALENLVRAFKGRLEILEKAVKETLPEAASQEQLKKRTFNPGEA